MLLVGLFRRFRSTARRVRAEAPKPAGAPHQPPRLEAAERLTTDNELTTVY